MDRNYLYFGDCLDVLRNLSKETIDLIYIDPPFNSKRNYNIFFDDKQIQMQRVAFTDTWTLKNIPDSLMELENLQTEKVYELLRVYEKVAPFAFPYLVMMSLRILELHRVLKSTGSFYLHCDPTMSHYLKNVCDLIFGNNNFRNEIIWHYRTGNVAKKQFQRKHDVIFFYSKTEKNIFNPLEIKEYYVQVYGPRFKPSFKGRKHGEDKHGQYRMSFIDDVWDIQAVFTLSREHLSYPTQKPLKLLERIIKASSNEGDIVLDSFCGCGTTIDAAEGLNRKWIGIDVSPQAIDLIERRLKNTYTAKAENTLSKYEIKGFPTNKESAIDLWKRNPFAFQDWWIMKYEAFSQGKGADKGVDGLAKYRLNNETTIKVAFQVKGGKVQSKDIDALLGAMSKHKCELGVFLSIEPLTKPMLQTISSAGFFQTIGFKYPVLQYVTIEEFFLNKQLKLPAENISSPAAKFRGKEHTQNSFD